MIREYMVLEIQFWTVNYMLVARICKNFEQNKPVWITGYITSFYITIFG